ncbi:unnamed protein product [Owenia fusiformis]|uniref:Repulsive guidance molecule A n=1 Tax=Owenia fusiformis TaxID=6347 RepID=A0A8S4PTG8_OWEFU|nr:unnamed protein product [Owenia fusiformis]
MQRNRFIERKPLRTNTTRWIVMGVRALYSSTVGPPSFLPLVIVTTILLATVQSCRLDDCSLKYWMARETLGEGVLGEPNQNHIKCVTLRTYYQCIRNMKQECYGDIQFHSVQKIVENKMKDNNCTVQGQIYTEAKYGSPRPRPANSKVCSFRPGSRSKNLHKHCGLFGDPHLRTFNEEYQTCKVQGAWPLVDNEFLTIQVTNEQVARDSTATATSKLTVMIKANDECAEDRYMLYLAQTDLLPDAFEDGSESFGPDDSVQLVVVQANKHVEIYMRYIDTTIIVRQVGRYFTFAIKMPEEIVQLTRESPDPLQLCARGCPKGEQINYGEFLAQKHSHIKSLIDKNVHVMSRENAVKKCSESRVVDFYFDSCVFDLMTTGDTNFTRAANLALQDVLRLQPSAAQSHHNRTSLHNYDVQYRLHTSGAYSVRTSPSNLYHRTTFLLLVILTYYILAHRGGHMDFIYVKASLEAVAMVQIECDGDDVPFTSNLHIVKG